MGRYDEPPATDRRGRDGHGLKPQRDGGPAGEGGKDVGDGGSSRRIPQLLSFLGINALLGAGVGLLIVIGLIGTNTVGLRDLIQMTSDPYSALLTICAMFMLTFASLAMGSAVMLLPWGVHRGNPLGKRGDDDER